MVQWKRCAWNCPLWLHFRCTLSIGAAALHATRCCLDHSVHTSFFPCSSAASAWSRSRVKRLRSRSTAVLDTYQILVRQGSACQPCLRCRQGSPSPVDVADIGMYSPVSGPFMHPPADVCLQRCSAGAYSSATAAKTASSGLDRRSCCLLGVAV
eukprot:s7550_g1.t1